MGDRQRSRSRPRRPKSLAPTEASGRGSVRLSRYATNASRPTTPPLYQLYSAGGIDDYGFYHHKPEEEHDQDQEEYEIQTRARPVSPSPFTPSAFAPSSHVPEDQLNDSAFVSDGASLELGRRRTVASGEEVEEYESEPRHSTSSESARSVDSVGRAQREKDIEKYAPSVISRKDTQQSKRDRNPNLVVWETDQDPGNPRNWARSRKWAATLTVSCFTFLSPVSSTIVSPAVTKMAEDLNVRGEVASLIMMSVFVLAYAFGPLFLGPLSEIYGRVPVIQLSNLVYLIFNLSSGFARNSGEMVAFRFFAGLGGSATLSIGGGVVSDLWKPEERGRAIAIYSVAPLIGPAMGPLAGGFIADNTTWRWVFWAPSIVDVAMQLMGLIFLQETYAPKLLKRKCDKLIKETGNEKLHTEFSHNDEPLFAKLRHNISRPFIFLTTQPIIQALSVYMGFLYGLVYLQISSYPTLWRVQYGQSLSISGLNFISIGIGYIAGSQLAGRTNDWTFRTMRRRNNGVSRPEFRCPVMVPGAIAVPVGLLMYGWSAQAKTHWIVPNIGGLIFSAGIVCGFQTIQAYAVDSYTRYAASALAAVAFLRSIAGFGFPLFAPYLYDSLDYGWGNTVLAAVAILLGIPGPFLLYFFGPNLRERSKFAAG